MSDLNVAIIGHRFMGKAHSHAWKDAPLFFDLPARPVMKVACGRSIEPLRVFAQRWGWAEIDTDWRRVVERQDIDVVDISVPHNLHYEIALAAARNGKHIFCEKPLALDFDQARQMYDAVRESGITHYVNFNYRRCPAVALAKQLIEEGKIGQIYHWRGAYMNSGLVDPTRPLKWTMLKEAAGSGPQASLNSHSVDLARYLVSEIRSVTAMSTNFITERPLNDVEAQRKGGKRGKVTVEDAIFMIAEFANGALGSFETTRFATGRRNYNYFEIYGSKGSLAFNLERLNELEYFSREEPEYTQGFKTILVTQQDHPYLSAWWPPGHIIGYEHTFIHAVTDFINAVASGNGIEPDFYDGMKGMQILDAGLASAKKGVRIALDSPDRPG